MRRESFSRVEVGEVGRAIHAELRRARRSD